MRRYWTLARLACWLVILLPIGWLWSHDPGRSGPGASSHQLQVVRSLEYGTGAQGRRLLDVYRPREEEPAGRRRGILRPAVLAIHGGSWIGGSRTDYGEQVSRLAEHGYVIFAADYALARPGSPGWPDALDNLREAVRWIRRHAAEHEVDPDRIIALGSGAGGHLALLLGTDPPATASGGQSSAVQGVVSLYGPSDLIELARTRNLENEPATVFLGVSPGLDPSRAREASPLSRVSRWLPPIMLIHGLDDAWVPPAQSLQLSEELTRAGVHHRLLLLPGARHGFEFELGPPTPRDILPDILAFLEIACQPRLPTQPQLPSQRE